MSSESVHKNRQAQLLKAHALVGSYAKLADLSGSNPAMLSNIGNGYANMGNKVARRIEAALDMPKDSFDQPLEAEGDLPLLIAKLSDDELIEAMAEVLPKLEPESLKRLVEYASVVLAEVD